MRVGHGRAYRGRRPSHTVARALGWGANPARGGTPGGGSGGAVYNDGNTFTLALCGARMTGNTAVEGGGAVFFVSNDRSGRLEILDVVPETAATKVAAAARPNWWRRPSELGLRVGSSPRVDPIPRGVRPACALDVNQSSGLLAISVHLGELTRSEFRFRATDVNRRSTG